MKTAETKGAPSPAPSDSVAEGISRREFVARLRRAAIFVAPVVAVVALQTPKAMGSYP